MGKDGVNPLHGLREILMGKSGPARINIRLLLRDFPPTSIPSGTPACVQALDLPRHAAWRRLLRQLWFTWYSFVEVESLRSCTILWTWTTSVLIRSASTSHSWNADSPSLEPSLCASRNSAGVAPPVSNIHGLPAAPTPGPSASDAPPCPSARKWGCGCRVLFTAAKAVTRMILLPGPSCSGQTPWKGEDPPPWMPPPHPPHLAPRPPTPPAPP